MQKFINLVTISTNIFLLLAVVYLAARLQKLESRVEYTEAEQISAQTAFFREEIKKCM